VTPIAGVFIAHRLCEAARATVCESHLRGLRRLFWLTAGALALLAVAARLPGVPRIVVGLAGLLALGRLVLEWFDHTSRGTVLLRQGMPHDGWLAAERLLVTWRP
jgi:hypothetical protein